MNAPPSQSETARAGDTSRFETQPTEPGSIFVDLDASRKAYLTLQAQLALKGYSLSELSGASYLVCRWDRSIHCSDLAQVRAFLFRLGSVS